MHHACRSPSLSHDIIPGKQIKLNMIHWFPYFRWGFFLIKTLYIYIYTQNSLTRFVHSVEPSQFSHRKKIYKIKNNEMQIYPM